MSRACSILDKISLIKAENNLKTYLCVVINYYLQKLNLEHIRIVAKTPYLNNQSMAVRKDWPILRSILQQALNAIPTVERKEIFRHWSSIRFERTVNYEFLWQILVVVFAVFVLVVFWNFSLKRMVKQRTEELRENESLLKQAQFVGLLGSWKLNHITSDLQWSDMIYTLFELDPDEFKPSYENFIRVIHPDDKEFVHNAFYESVKNKTQYNVEHRLLMGDRRIKYVNERCQTTYDEHGTPLFSLGTVQDVTERKKLEMRLQKLALAVEQSPESIVITNTKVEIEYVNDTFVKNSGYSREEVIGKNPRILHSGHTPEQTYIDLWQHLTNGREWKGEFYNKRQNGEEYIEFAIIAPLRQSDGKITHYVSIQKEITEKKKMGLELDEYRNHLEKLVASRTIELNKALESRRGQPG